MPERVIRRMGHVTHVGGQPVPPPRRDEGVDRSDLPRRVEQRRRSNASALRVERVRQLFARQQRAFDEAMKVAFPHVDLRR